MKPSMELDEGRPSNLRTSCGVVALVSPSVDGDETCGFFSILLFVESPDELRYPEELDEDDDLYPDEGDERLPLELDFWKGSFDLL